MSAKTLPECLRFHLTSLLLGKIRQSSSQGAIEADPVKRALAIMTQRYAERLTCLEIATKVGTSVSHLHALFRVATGKGPAETLADVRLDFARSMLQETTLPIAEIAVTVGFSDQTALTRCLKRRRGTTPAALRRYGGVSAEPRSE